MFEILVRASHWKYSRCLLGIYSAKLTWRSCHGSYKGMAWISLSVAGRSVLLCGYIAARFQLPRWRGGPGGRLVPVVGLSARPTPAAPPESSGGSSADCSPHPPRATSDASLPLSSCLNTGSILIGGPWRSRRSSRLCMWAFICHWVSFSLFQSPATRWGGKRKRSEALREENKYIQFVAKEFSLVHYTIILFFSLDKIRTVTRTHQEANLGNNTRGKRRQQVIKSHSDHLCQDVEWTCQVEGPSSENYFRSTRLRSWGHMAWSV